MSDAEVLAQFRKQDLAKNQLNEEIKKIQEHIKEGLYKGFVSISVISANTSFTGVEFSLRDSSSAPIKGSGPQSLALLPVHTLKSTIIINIDTEVDIDDSGELNASDVSELKTYTGEFDCSELSSESYLVTDVNASSSGEEIIASIKVAFESFEKTLQSKELELEQLTKTISELKDSSRQIRDKDKLRKNLAKKSTSSSGSGKIKKSKPTRAGSENTKSGSGAQDSDDKSEEKSSSFSVEALSQYVLMGGALALEHRAFLLFPIAAAAIFFGGEVMSV